MKMRDATPEERETINEYIESISMKTGRTFQEILDSTLIIDNSLEGGENNANPSTN